MPGTHKYEIKAEHLLEKGTEILWSKGYNGTSVNDIVKAAGIPKGSFYFYFKSKEDFAIKAIEHYFNENIGPFLSILEDKATSPVKRLVAVYEYRIEKLKGELNCKLGCLASNIGNEMSEHSESIRKVILEKEKFYKGKLVEVAEEAQECGEINASLNVTNLIEFIEDAGKGAMITMKEMQSSYPIDNHLNMIKTVILK